MVFEHVHHRLLVGPVEIDLCFGIGAGGSDADVPDAALVAVHKPELQTVGPHGDRFQAVPERLETGNGVGQSLLDLLQALLSRLQAASQILKPGVELHSLANSLGSKIASL